jgi:hypothetical protein
VGREVLQDAVFAELRRDAELGLGQRRAGWQRSDTTGLLAGGGLDEDVELPLQGRELRAGASFALFASSGAAAQ